MQKGALANVIINNIFAFGGVAQLCSDTDRAHVFEYNIVYWDSGPLFLRRAWTNFDRVYDYNLYFRTDGEPIEFFEWTFEQWQQQGAEVSSYFTPGKMDAHSAIADPLFVDASSADFHLRPDSPALEMGFRPIDQDAAGVTGDSV